MNQAGEQRLTIPDEIPPGLKSFCTHFARLVGLGLVSGHIMHDIRNSLAVVSGHAQIIQLKGEKVSGEDIVKRMDQIIDQVDKILDTINQVGSYTARAKGDKSEFSPDNALENAVHGLERRFENAGLHVKLQKSETSKNIWCDGSLSDFVLLQLLETCIPDKHTGGQVKISTNEDMSWWEAEIIISSQTDTEELRSKLIESSKGFDLVAVLIALEELNGVLYLLTDPEKYGFKLRIPWKVDEEGVVY